MRAPPLETNFVCSVSEGGSHPQHKQLLASGSLALSLWMNVGLGSSLGARLSAHRGVCHLGPEACVGSSPP